ncbi:MAG TPA: M28 family peptidase [Phycisphaerales bacterium]|nr:M28 family peptidase [Phycisphaerales bacterium]
MQSLLRGLMPLTLAACAGLATAQPGDTGVKDAERDLHVYSAHVNFLANEFMDGRVPGSNGAQLAKDYAERFMKLAGLEPAFASTEVAADGSTITMPGSSYRQSFPLGGTIEITKAELTARAGDQGMEFDPNEEFVITGLGGPGHVSGDAVFVGYSIPNGPDGFSSYPEDADLTGKVAVMYRFEPMDSEGNSLWADNGPWSSNAGFNVKLRGAFDRGAEAVIVINTPWANDERIERLNDFRGNGRGSGNPVLMMSTVAGQELLNATGEHTAKELWEIANTGGEIVDLHTTINIDAEMDQEVLHAENVGGILRGKGDLADEWIIVGAHIDHIGMGYFGSRSGAGQLHPGADDNATGSAAVLLLADLVGRSYAMMPDDADARSVLFMCFDAEESGLNGSRYYVQNPIVPNEDVAVMINFDMIGRVLNDRLVVAGLETATGLEEKLDPIFANSGLEIVKPPEMNGASDHTSFYNAKIPVLFSIIADFHTDYHTPGDVAWKLNNESATQVCHMYHDIILELATNPERPEFVQSDAASSGPNLGDITVRLGIMPDYNASGLGFRISDVNPDGPADKGGIKPGDHLIRWDGQKVKDIRSWMGMLVNYKPGDVVKVGVDRDGEEVTLEITLGAK